MKMSPLLPTALRTPTAPKRLPVALGVGGLVRFALSGAALGVFLLGCTHPSYRNPSTGVCKEPSIVVPEKCEIISWEHEEVRYVVGYSRKKNCEIRASVIKYRCGDVLKIEKHQREWVEDVNRGP